MAGEDDATLSQTPSWRLSLLFLLVVILSLAGHIGLHKLEEYFKRNKRKGLLHTLQSLKDELFALGLITLLLIVFEDLLIRICVDDADYKSYSQDPYIKARRLLAGGDSNSCGKGDEPFWSLTVLHDIHIFIFLIAIVHLFYAALSMTLAWLKVRGWRKWEKLTNHDMQPLKKKWVVRTRGSYWGLWMRAFFTQFIETVDGPIYLALRRLFIERMEVDDDFDFHAFVVESLEEDFAKMVEFEWIMWLIAAVWILLPAQAYIVIWLPCLFLVVQLCVGAKLEAIIIQLASLAYTHYSPHFIPFKYRSKSKIDDKRGLFRRSANVMKNILQRTSPKLSRNSLTPTVNSNRLNNGASMPRSRSVEEFTQMNNQAALQKVVSDPSAVQATVFEIESKRQESGGEVTVDITNSSNLAEVEERPFKRRCCFYVDTRTNKVIRRSMSQHFASKYLLKDAADLFWFRKPKILLRLFQYTYFQSGLVTAILILEKWRGGFYKKDPTSNEVSFIMIGVNLLIMVHSALFLLPMYALTTAAGSHCPERVLKKALKKNVNPELAKQLQLERNSFIRQGSVTSEESASINEAVVAARAPSQPNLKRQSRNHHHHHDVSYVGPIASLLEAMSQAQERKKQGEEDRPVLQRHSVGAVVGGRGQITGRTIPSLEPLIETHSIKERNQSFHVREDGVASEPDAEDTTHASLSQVYQVFELAKTNNAQTEPPPAQPSSPTLRLDAATLKQFNENWKNSQNTLYSPNAENNEIEVVIGTDSEPRVQFNIPLDNIKNDNAERGNLREDVKNSKLDLEKSSSNNNKQQSISDRNVTLHSEDQLQSRKQSVGSNQVESIQNKNQERDQHHYNGGTALNVPESEEEWHTPEVSVSSSYQTSENKSQRKSADGSEVLQETQNSKKKNISK